MPEVEPRTKLARIRLDRGIGQHELAWMTGLSIATYQRLERGSMGNPGIRYLVNCAIALGVELDEVIEDDWREWYPFSPRAQKPPAPE
jgi:transcriptional regulator with XRE-family HTH domain